MSLRNRVPIGTPQWVLFEKLQAGTLISQESEDFSYCVHNEFEWLNEHMNEILSGNRPVADVFKTPGKLRGRTPKTPLRRLAPHSRVPLGDLFAPNAQSSVPFSLHRPADFVHHVEIAPNNDVSSGSPTSKRLFPKATSFENRAQIVSKDTDCVFFSHAEECKVGPKSTLHPEHCQTAIQSSVTAAPPSTSPFKREECSTLRNFANKPTSNNSNDKVTMPATSVVVCSGGLEVTDDTSVISRVQRPSSAQSKLRTSNNATPVTSIMVTSVERLVESDKSEPDHARDEDKSTKREANVDANSMKLSEKPSINLVNVNKALPLAPKADEPENVELLIGSIPGQFNLPQLPEQMGKGDEGVAKLMNKAKFGRSNYEIHRDYNQTSTQRLQEKISLLGKCKESLPALNNGIEGQKRTNLSSVVNGDRGLNMGSKSSGVSVSKVTVTNSEAAKGRDIGEGKSFMNKLLPSVDKKTENFIKATKSPRLGRALSTKRSRGVESTPQTPRSATSKRFNEGPLSASKAKLYSVLRSAKGMFASSANVSAQAKVDSQASSPFFGMSHKGSKESEKRMAGSPSRASIPEPEKKLEQAGEAEMGLFGIRGVTKGGSENEEAANSVPPVLPILDFEARVTRSSTEQKRKELAPDSRSQQKGSSEETDVQKSNGTMEQKPHLMEVSRESNRVVPPLCSTKVRKSGEGVEEDGEGSTSRHVGTADELSKSQVTGGVNKSLLPLSQQIRMAERKRGAKAVKGRPTPVSIKLASQRVGQIQVSNATLSASLTGGSLATTNSQYNKRSICTVKTSSTSTSVSCASNQGVNGTKVGGIGVSGGVVRGKTIDVTAKKRERKIEIKKTAGGFEEKRNLKVQTTEIIRKPGEAEAPASVKSSTGTVQSVGIPMTMSSATRVAVESKKKREMGRPVSRNEREGIVTVPGCGDKSRGGLHQTREVVGISGKEAAKALKRTFKNDGDEGKSKELGNEDGQKGSEWKRRKTDETAWGGDVTDESNKESTGSRTYRGTGMTTIQTISMSHATTTTASSSSSLFKSTVKAQHNLQHGHTTDTSDRTDSETLMKNACGKSTKNGLVENSDARKMTNTPLQMVSEEISLPDIPSDYFDEDSGNERFIGPDWTNSPELKEQLLSQQLVDPRTVFGAVGPIKMEEIFKGSDRYKILRDRTSSAAWATSGDLLTEEERQNDLRARERLVRNGGWVYDPGN